MTDDTVPQFELGDALALRCGNTLAAQFVPSTSKIALNAYRPVKWNTRDAPTDTAGQDKVMIYFLQESTLYTEPLLRSLLAESNVAFVTLQSMCKLDKGDVKSTDYLKMSRSYRSVVRCCLEKLEQSKSSLEVQHDELKQQRYLEATMTFYSIECLWNLFEILYMHQTQLIVPNLLDWVRFHFPETEDRVTDLLLMAEEASESDKYWETIKSLIMFGQLDVTRAILSQNCKSKQPAYQAAEAILNSMPIYQDGYAMQKFCTQWENWRADLERKLAAQVFALEPELETVMQLVAGSNKHWDAELLNSQEWYEFLPGYLLYTRPTCKPFELRIAATNWVNRWAQLRPNWQMTLLSRTVMQLMEHDIKLFIYGIQKLNDGHWFATHLIDLIYHMGQLKPYCDQHSIDLTALRHSLVIDYGSYLMTSHNLWQLGIDYLDCCNEQGMAAIELLLPRIPIKTERQAFKLINIAQKRGLQNVQQDICKVLSRRAYDDQRYGNALEWAVRSTDILLITAIADFMLKQYTKTGKLVCKDVIDNIGARMFVSPRLVFLSKYYEFQTCNLQGDFLSATELLVNLISCRITPDYFWPTLLADTLPLLASPDPKIFANETVAILQQIEMQLVPLMKSNKFKSDKVNDETQETSRKIEEMIPTLRSACASNLSRAFIIENSASQPRENVKK